MIVPFAQKNFLRLTYLLRGATLYQLAYNTTVTNQHNLVRKLLKYGLVAQVSITGTTNRELLRHTYFYPTREGARDIGIMDYRPAEPKSANYPSFDHQYGLRDVLIALCYAFKDYDVEIDMPVNSEKYGYKPDAVLKATDIATGKEYVYFVEFERTKKPSTVIKLVEDRLKASKKAKGCYNAKHLYIFTNEYFDVVHDNHDQQRKEIIVSVERDFNTLMDKAKGLPNCVRFAKLHDYQTFGEAVWHLPGGERIKLINN
jgi:hypothetical protein